VSPTLGKDDKPAAGRAEEAALKAAAAFYDGIYSETLPNGLKVYLKPINGSPTVTTMVAYKVGSTDEDLTATGLSHYLEHLMFKGTDKIMPGDIDRLTLRNGGANNAYTTEDYTIYHFDFAADRWEAALEVEADRMQNLRIDAKHEFEQEKGAVISELKRNEDEPWDLEQKAILPLLYGKSAPLGHPVIGETQHVRAATAQIIKAHYDKWYHPNNASLIICGGFDLDRTRARVKELFGPIPSKSLPERKQSPQESLQRPARIEMNSKFESPRMLVGFNTIPSGHRDSAALEVISGVLTGGKTGRLYKRLVEGEEVASEVDSGSYVGRYPGWFSVQVELIPGKDRAKAEKIALEELQRLGKEPISAEELKRIQQTLLTDTIFNRESVHNLADSIARGVTTNDLDYLKEYLPRLLRVTAADVQRVAQKYLDPEKRVVVWSYPQTKQGSGVRGEGAAGKIRGLAARSARLAAGAGEPFSLKDAKRVELPNGLILLLYEDHRLPIVAVQAAVRRVALLEPENKAGVAALMGYLLDEGTTKHSGPAIAELIENAGASLSLNSAGGMVRMLSMHRQLGLGLLVECLTQANFPTDEFNRQKQRLLSQIDDAERRPDAKALRMFRELVYGKHPLGRPPLGRRLTVEPLTPADCATFYHRAFVPNNTLMAVIGDFDSKQIVDEITRLTADWKQGKDLKPQEPEVTKPPEFVEKIVSMPDAAQLHFYMGHVGIRRNSPDYYKLLVMDYVLGTGPGFTDRLSARLRDREGLAYTVQANISSSAGEEPGVFTCYIGTDPENFEKVKAMFLEELNRIRDQKPTAKEVEDAKQYLLGNLPFHFTTDAQIGSQLLYVERNQLGFGYIDDYKKAVSAVTPEDVQEVARKYLDPKRMVLVVTGAVDAKGKPLSKP
jgi:zinc protease